MALVKCQECGKDVSDKAPVCPHCGAPVDEGAVSPKKAQSLKGGGTLLIILSIIFELTGFGELAPVPGLFIYLMAVGVVMVIAALVVEQRAKQAHHEDNKS